MTLQALGYIGFRANGLEDWAAYGARCLGLQLVDRSRSSLAFRMDDRKQRVIIHDEPGGGAGFFGWEVADGSALAQMATQLEAAGVTVAHGSPALAQERRVAELIVFSDPLGNRLEVFHGGETASDPFAPGRNISGFRTGPLGMGHVVLTVERLDAVLPFYQDVLGFRVTDYVLKPFRAFFLHTNPRHHSIAFIETGTFGLHHLMMELCNLDDVGQGYDLALTEPERIGATLGRHSNDWMTSFYWFTPSQFMIEYGWGGRTIEVGNVEAREISEGPNLWGHDRRWLNPEANAAAQQMARKAAEKGIRRPVQVSEGNYQLPVGICNWWDSVKEKNLRRA